MNTNNPPLRRWMIYSSLAAIVLALALPGGAIALAAPARFVDPAGPVFINEIHYDNTGTDTGEAIEIFGPAGTDLTGWRIVRYNGANGLVYTTPTADPAGSDVLSGTIPDLCDGFGFVTVNYLANGLQNGAPDGVALVDASNTVVQFLSYEGAFAAVDGPAGGMMSTDIGVSEPDTTLAGLSLQLTGSGTVYDDFVWSGPAASTFGAANTGQTCGTVAAGGLVINEVDYDQPGTDTAEFVEIRNNDAEAVDLSGYSLQFINGASGGAAPYRLFALPAVLLAPGGYFVLCGDAATVANCDLDVTPDTDLIQNGAPDAVALLFGSEIVDTVSYEGDTGAPYTEGSGAGLVDTATGAESIARCPDGSDTDQNNVDFSLRAITPGAANACAADAPPAVASTNPANGAVEVSISANIAVTFSEDVTVSGAWYDITCAVSGTHSATPSGGPLAHSLDPDADFAFNELCTVTIFAAGVADQDGTPHNMAADFVFSFTTESEPIGMCGDPFTPIYAIQGAGLTAAITGIVTTEGVVVGDFEGGGGLQGFYLQDAAGDGDGATSDGIFVFTGGADTVSAGQAVRVKGFARERFNQTALNGANDNNAPVPAANILLCGDGSVAPVDVFMPFDSTDYLERFEGMLVRFPQALVISEYFNYERFGEIVLALPLDGETRPFTGTAIDEPGPPALARALANSLRRVTLDDGLGIQNPDFVRHPNGGVFALDNRFRGGDSVANAVGVLGFDFSLYRIQPTGAADYSPLNPRPAAPEPVGGRLKVASFNTLNYFLTLDFPTGDPQDNKCGPLQNVECRGADADQPLEFTRQRDKLLAALAGLDADVVGLNELENTAGVDPLGDPTHGLVTGLNDIFGPGAYAHIDTGVIGTDAIRVGLIYRPAAVTPVGGFQILDASVDPRFRDNLNRPALAQTFEEVATGERFTVVVNHLKSKGSDCNAVGDPDIGDGQGNCNQTRLLAAQAMVDWLATDPTGSGDPDFLITGDLNSYAQEDPIDAIKAGPDDMAGTADDYTNLIAQFGGAFAYSFVFDGQSGYLDHALANATLAAQATGATEWHINADEPDLLDYDTTFKPPAQDAIYEPNAFRSSDHDPVIVGLNLIPQCHGQNATVYVGADGRIVGGPLNGQIYRGTLIGTPGADVIVGTEGDDHLVGQAGDDLMCARGGNDMINGGPGSDTIDSGEGDDEIVGNTADDIVLAGAAQRARKAN